MKDISDRKEVIGLTIDPMHSKDLDDAIHLEKVSGGWKIYVSIADPAFGIPIGSKLDYEAGLKAFTRYFPSHNDPMLPKSISEDSFSLWDGKERPVITVSMFLSEDLEIMNPKIERMRLKSRYKLSYEDVNKILFDNSHELYIFMNECHELAQALLARRRRNGALAIYDINSGWMTNEDGVLVKIASKSEYYSHIIIQEFMIMANELVANFCARKDIPILFRNHSAKTIAPGREDIIKEIYETIANPNLFPVEKLQQKMNLVLERAVYAPIIKGHYGLNLAAYTHFTSPLRRYPDLVNHRIIIATLEGESLPYSIEDLKKIAEHCTSVDQDLRHKQKESYKKRDAIKASKQLASGSLQTLSDSDFHRVLKVAMEKELPSELEAEINRRLDDLSLPIQDIYLILFVVGKNWDSVKNKALAHIVSQSNKSISIFSIASQELGWGRISFETIRSGTGHAPQFTSTAKISIDDRQFVSHPRSSSKKKEAEQRAATNLIGVIINTDIEKTLTDTQAVVKQEAAPKTENYKGKLLEICTKNRWSIPMFTIVQKGMAHAPHFSAEVSITINGINYSSDIMIGASKKQVEQLSSSNLIGKIQHLANKQEKGVITVLAGNFVGALQELCQKESYSFPKFSSPQMSGQSHMPMITIICTLNTDTDTVSAQAIAKTVKEAKQKAAEQIFAILTDR